MGLGLDLNGPESLDPLAPQYHSHKRTKIIIIITTTTTTTTKLNVMNHVKLLAFLSAQILVAFKIIITLDYIER